MILNSLYASFCPPSQESVPPQASPEVPVASALEVVVSHVNCLIAILRVPNDKTLLRTDLSKQEHEQVSRCLIEASRALNRISQEYRVYSLTVSSMLEDENKSALPAYDLFPNACTSQIKYADSVQSSMSDFEPAVNSDMIAVGAIFPSLDAAGEAFSDYAINAGFNICKGNSKKDVYQEFACSSRGKVRSRKVVDSVKRRNRASVKKSCKCHIILRKKGQEWTITTRKLGHSHDLMTEEEIQMTAKNRFIPDEVKDKAVSMYLEGETPAKIQNHLQDEYGGKVTWSMKDLYNMLYRHKRVSKT